MKSTEFVIFDVETTGLSPAGGDRIVEIAALKIKDLKIVDRFEVLVDPCREISFGAYLVNGITPQMLKGAPRAVEVLPDFLDFIGEACLVGHNIRFDLGFLHQELQIAGHSPLEERFVIDTVKMARGLIPDLGSYSLSSVAYALGVETPQEHRAMADVTLNFSVFAQLIKIAQRKDIEDFKACVDLFGYRLLKKNERYQKR